MVREIKQCRACGAEGFKPVINLGTQFVVDFPKNAGEGFSAPLNVVRCTQCSLVQLVHSVSAEKLYKKFWYKSGISETMRQALDEIVRKVNSVVQLNAGDRVLDIGCFPEGNVITKGFKPKDISKVELGEKILDQQGTFTKVVDKFERDYVGRLVELRVQGTKGKIRATEEHPILVIRNEKDNSTTKRILGRVERSKILESSDSKWVPANQVRKGDYVLLPELRECPAKVPDLDLRQILSLDADKEYVYSWQQSQWIPGKKERARNQCKVKRFVPITEDFGRLLGYYIAEGSSNGRLNNACVFSFSAKEKTYHRDVIQLVKKLFGLTCTVGDNRRELDVATLHVSSKIVASLLKLLCGDGAKNKQLPDWFFCTTKEFKRGLLQGLFRGDGACGKGLVQYGTVSETLAYQVMYLLHFFRIPVRMTQQLNRGYGKGKVIYGLVAEGKNAKKKLVDLGIGGNGGHLEGVTNNKWPVVNGFRLARVKALERSEFRGKVFNLKTESETYVVDSFVVHNCNDGTLLEMYPPFVTTVGIDPCHELVLESSREHRVDIAVTGFFRKEAVQDAAPFKAITAVAMFYDVEDPKKFLEDCRDLLTDDGVLVIQMNYLKTMLENTTVDNISHEHLTYWSLTALKRTVAAVGMELMGAETNDVNGGSIRVYITKRPGVGLAGMSLDRQMALYGKSVALVIEELKMHLDEDGIYDWFRRTAGQKRDALRGYLLGEKQKGGKLYVYGASTRGTALLQVLGLPADTFLGAAERDERKYGLRMVGTGIPIVSEAQARAEATHFLVLPYHFREQIELREQQWMAMGGTMIFPLPVPTILKDGMEKKLVLKKVTHEAMGVGGSR